MMRALVALGASLVLAACGTATASAPSTGDTVIGLTTYPVGERPAAPDISGRTLDGSALSLASLRGRVVVLNSWASWCEPCQEELPVLVAAARAADPSRVAFLGLDVNDRAADAAAMARRFSIPYPSVVDDGARLLGRIPGVPPGALPSTVVIDQEGRIAARVIGTVKPGMLEPVLSGLTPSGLTASPR